ncbi:FecR protein [Rubripirellula obstinata]|uniref:FecR protein n=1 Tax=Rubripirellula obstinata TaxID=406547 RepID=A0A5B1CI56_9BACT|nr:LamG-like jellyroll fold domain-containing protein [Rubripirellula obstinata]KAA1259912.1 FecR protein [Rubripirellula obstinata]
MNESHNSNSDPNRQPGDDDAISPAEVYRLINGLLDDQLQPHEAERLCAALKSSEQYREIYLELIDVHAGLAWQRHWPIPVESILATSGLNQRAAEDAFANQQIEPASTLRSASSSGWSSSEWLLGNRRRVAAIATIAVAACIAFAVVSVSSPKPSGSVDGLAMSDDSAMSGSESPANPDAGTKTADRFRAGSLAKSVVTPAAFHQPGVARIGSSIDAAWNRSATPDSGNVLGSGWLQLDSGLVRLDFFSGVRMTVQGPARLELRSEWEVFLDSGSVRCEVSEMGKGFRVQARGMDVVDLGTEFGMRVGPSGDPEVHVISGKVALIDEAGNPKLEIVERQAMQMSDGQLHSTPYSESGFTSVGEVTQRSNRVRERNFLEWKRHADEISQDPTTVIHYTLQDQDRDDLQVTNEAAQATSATDALIIGCDLTDGRWPGKKAIRFQGGGDRLLLAVDQPQESMTIMMWLQVNDHNQELMGLLMGEEPDRRLNANAKWMGGLRQAELEAYRSAQIKLTRWGLWQSGALHLGQFRRPADDPIRDWEHYDTEPNQTLVPSRRWNHIAVTYDGPSQEISQFVNGEEVASWDTEYGDSLRLGHLAIGNLSVDQTEINMGVTREFFGAIDEVVISSRAYSADEIQACFTVGKP